MILLNPKSAVPAATAGVLFFMAAIPWAMAQEGGEAIFVDPEGSTPEKSLPLKGEVEAADGLLALQWEAADGKTEGGGTVFVLEQSDSETFADTKVRYRGPDSGTYLSGLREGEYFFRIKAEGDGWSAPLKVNMTHIGRKKLAVLFFTGMLVAAATVGAILRGYFRDKGSEETSR